MSEKCECWILYGNEGPQSDRIERCAHCLGLEQENERLERLAQHWGDKWQQASEHAAELEKENERLREYIELVIDGTARLTVIAGFPPLDAIYPDAAKLARVKELRKELYG